jgi:hypothetical protein
VEAWTRAVVVVDVANVANEIADAAKRHYGKWVYPDLAALVGVLARLGIDTVELVIAMPTTAVAVWGSGFSDAGRRRLREGSRWLTQQRSALSGGVELTIAAGASDGRQEWGVDESAVGTALLRLRHHLGASLIVMSGDGDLDLIADYVAPELDCGVFLANRAARPHQRRRWAQAGRGWIRLTAADYAHMGTEPARTGPPPRVRMSADGRTLRQDDGTVRSSDLVTTVGAAVGLRMAGLTGTVAVVDAFGLANAAARAIGAGRLPDATSVEVVLRTLGFDPPFAMWFVTPDLPDHALRGRHGHEHRAWAELDVHLDVARHATAADDDPLTSTVASELKPPRRMAWDVLRRGVEEKRVSTALVADVVHALQTYPDTQVAVLSDRPEVEVALRLIDLDASTRARITRVGVHREPVELRPPAAVRHHLVELPAQQLAQLTRVSSQASADRLRAALLDTVTSPTSTWHFVHYDPVANGAVMHLAGDRSVQVIVGDLMRVAARMDRAMATGLEVGPGAQFVLEYDPNATCAMPTVRLGTADPMLYARVIEVTPVGIKIDVDSDGAPDSTIVGWHGTGDPQAGDGLAVREVDATYHLVAALRPSTQPPELVVAEVAGGDVPCVCLVDGGDVLGIDGGWLPGRRPPDGARVLVISPSDGRARVVSTALPVLQRPPAPSQPDAVRTPQSKTSS